MNKVDLKKVDLIMSKEWGRMKLGNFKTASDIDLFIGLLKVYQKTHELSFNISFSDFNKQLSINHYLDKTKKMQYYNTSRMVKHLDDMTDGLAQMFIKYYYDDEGSVIKNPVFDELKIDAATSTMSGKWKDTPIVLNLLEELTANNIIRRDFYMLSSKYAKILYIMLKEFDNNQGKIYKSKGHCEYIISADDFCEKMNVPKSYRRSCNLWDRVIKPAVEECKTYFNNLECTAKGSSTRGNKTTGYIFTWIPDNKVITEKQKAAIEHKAAGDYRPTDKTDKKSDFMHTDYDFDDIEKRLVRN